MQRCYHLLQFELCQFEWTRLAHPVLRRAPARRDGDAVRRGRETHLSVFDAQKTMELCLAADLSAEKGGRPVRLPLIPEHRRD